MVKHNPALRAPAARRLRVYAFDPQASLDLGSARYGHAVISLPWDDPADGLLERGPVNDYLEVIDIDPTSNQFYEPIDLNAPEVLAQDGLTPSEGDPRFHQQMVFAVAMKTIKQFERALGRKVIWAPTWNDKTKTYDPTPKLRVYPHALREANAYYSRDKRALLFGYFRAAHRSAGASWIFTALSHDIIVHETTHAILDGLHPRYSEPTSRDSLAFHEAFADIAALFSHFQLYEAVYDYIDKQGGRLDQSGLLTGLAGQFAAGATGRASLRDYIDKKPDADAIETTQEPHARGAILVAAVFDAFLSIYRARTADLLRLSGLREGDGRALHPDLTHRLTAEATKSADHVLRMCIRALDYLPPVDVRFGEFLRAIITADTDLIPDDRLNYRLAFVEAFRRRGIFPDNCLSMSPDNLLWDRPLVERPRPGAKPDLKYLDASDILLESLDLTPHYLRREIIKVMESNRKKVWYWLVQPALSLGEADPEAEDLFKVFLAEARAAFASDDEAGRAGWKAFLGRNESYFKALTGISDADYQSLPTRLDELRHFARWEAFFNHLVASKKVKKLAETDRAWEDALGIRFARRSGDPMTIHGQQHSPHVEVHSVRTTRRAGPDGQDVRQLVIEVTQRRRGYFLADTQLTEDKIFRPPQTTGWQKSKAPDFWFRAGATLIIDLRDGALRYVISKRIDDDRRLADQRAFLRSPTDLGFTYDGGRMGEPFAMLHRH
jgi:hypothetical protein